MVRGSWGSGIEVNQTEEAAVLLFSHGSDLPPKPGPTGPGKELGQAGALPPGPVSLP